MLRALPDDGKRYEIVRGELLVTPSPSWTHQLAVKRLVVPLDTYLRSTADLSSFARVRADPGNQRIEKLWTHRTAERSSS